MPSWTRTPNAILETLPQMGAAEIRVTLALVRQIYGFHQQQVRLTYPDLMRLTGLGSRSSINTGIKQVLSRGFFQRDSSRQIWTAAVSEDQPSVQGARRQQRVTVAGSKPPRKRNGPNRSDRGSRAPGAGDPTEAAAGSEPVSAPVRTASQGNAGPLPEKLDKPEFRELWFIYQGHLRELGRPLTMASAQMNLRRLGQVGYEEAVARLNRAIERNWKSLFYPGDERDFARPDGASPTIQGEKAWQLVCRLSANGSLAEIPPGIVRQAVIIIGEERLYRMSPQARPFIKREFLEALQYAGQTTR